MFYRSCLIIGLALSTAACKTTAQEAPLPVIIAPVEFKTCTEISALQRVVVPAVTKTFIAITEVDNPPYEPIQRREEIVREIEPEKIIFVDSAGFEVTDICEPEVAPGL